MKRRVRDQEATDAQGRRRFHGAFTGGFSAGHYNSVGSKEGWTPKTFSSSRSNRSSYVEQRPEDFMDEEDDPLLGKRLETTECYDTLQTGAKRRLQEQQSDQSVVSAIPGFLWPNDWNLPVNDSIGMKLLKRMGWKEGHGIGQPVRRRKFDKVENKQPKEVLRGDEEQNSEPDDEEVVYVPPRKVFDVRTSFPKPKLDRYGAGFDPYRDAPEFHAFKEQQKNKQKEREGSHRHIVSFVDALKSTNGTNRATNGYGLSALEENDDIDVYGTISMDDFDRAIAPLRAKNDVKRLESSSQHETLRLSRALCSDGRPVLPGFELAIAKESPSKAVNFHLNVPTNFKAYHRFDNESDQYDAVTSLYRKYHLLNDIVKSGVLVTAKQRGALLEDAGQDVQDQAGNAATVTTGSVFDLLGEEQKAKIFKAAANAKQDVLLSDVERAPSIAARKDRQILGESCGGKQLRASISASISKRFVSSTSIADENTSDSVSSKQPILKASYRSTSPWIPKSLLCKRFHVKCVGPTGSEGPRDSSDIKQNLYDKELVPHLVEFASGRAAYRKSDNIGKSFEVSTVDVAAGGNQLPVAPAQKASLDLLKSIFEPSDESLSEDDSDDESGVEGNSDQCNVESTESTTQQKESVRLPSTVLSSARGIHDRHQSNPQESSSSDEANATMLHYDDFETKELNKVDGQNAEQRTKERKLRTKHKKRHKHRSLRDEKVRKKKAKKEQKERKSHRRHTLRHSRYSRSPSAARTPRSSNR
ncbi:putative G patch domain-containing protein [Plasmopara halstedii]